MYDAVGEKVKRIKGRKLEVQSGKAALEAAYKVLEGTEKLGYKLRQNVNAADLGQVGSKEMTIDGKWFPATDEEKAKLKEAYELFGEFAINPDDVDGVYAPLREALVSATSSGDEKELETTLTSLVPTAVKTVGKRELEGKSKYISKGTAQQWHEYLTHLGINNFTVGQVGLVKTLIASHAYQTDNFSDEKTKEADVERLKKDLESHLKEFQE